MEDGDDYLRTSTQQRRTPSHIRGFARGCPASLPAPVAWPTLPAPRALTQGGVARARVGTRRPALAWAAEHTIPPLASRTQAGLGARILRPALRGGGLPVHTTHPRGVIRAIAGIPAAATSGVGETANRISVSSTTPSATTSSEMISATMM